MDVTVTFLEFKKKGWFLPKKNRIKRNTNQKKYLDEIKILMLHTQLVFDLCKSPAVKEKVTYTKNNI